MKKTNFSYLAVWAGIPAAVAAVLAILAFAVFMGNSGGYLPAGTVVTIIDRAGRTWGYYQHYGQTLRLSDLAYGTPPASASYKAPGRSPGSQIVDFYGPQMEELRNLLGW